MLNALGERQQALLRLLLTHKAGLTPDEIASELGISRQAIGQHLSALEAEGYLERGDLRRTAGRPRQTYKLTARGHELFPKQYGWFSGIILEAIRNERGDAGLEAWLEQLAGVVAGGLAPRMAGRDAAGRLEEAAAILQELAFEARLSEGGGVEAANCVYHELAVRFPQVCHFDRVLLSRLLGAEVDQPECMAQGGNVCRFVAK